MAAVERFEDLKCWQAARQVTALVYTMCEEGKLARDFATRDQLKRAALSAMSNIAEGSGRRFNTRDFIMFLDISQSSCLEVKSITYALDDAKLADEEKIIALRKMSDDAERLVLAFIRYLRHR